MSEIQIEKITVTSEGKRKLEGEWTIIDGLPVRISEEPKDTDNATS